MEASSAKKKGQAVLPTWKSKGKAGSNLPRGSAIVEPIDLEAMWMQGRRDSLQRIVLSLPVREQRKKNH